MAAENYFKTIDERCGTTNNMTALSIFSATSSGVLMLFTVPLNAMIVYCIIKERKKKYKSLFYKLLLNIAIADLLTGLIADPTAVNSLWKEALRAKLEPYEVYVIHVSLFFTDAVALITLTVLSIDRIMALVVPIKHHKGMKARNENIVVVIAWPIAFLLVVPYFKLNFIKQLAVFSTINIVVCILSLIVTTITYRKSVTHVSFTSKLEKKKKKKKKKNNEEESDDHHMGLDQQHNKSTAVTSINNIELAVISSDVEGGSAVLDKIPLHHHQPSNQLQPPKHRSLTQKSSTDGEVVMKQAKQASDNKMKNSAMKGQKKATRTFILMLCVFVATYLPTCFTMIYMNVCEDCDCVIVHIMRDISILSILSSSVLRPLNFILTLRHLRASVYGLFVTKRSYAMSSSTGVVSG